MQVAVGWEVSEEPYIVKRIHLRFAGKLMKSDDDEDALLYTAVYHCQQASTDIDESFVELTF